MTWAMMMAGSMPDYTTATTQGLLRLSGTVLEGMHTSRALIPHLALV